MKKTLLLLIALLAGVSGAWAETYDFVTAQTKVTEVAGITSGKYYVIDGLNQVNNNAHFLFDNGTKVTSNNPQTLPTDPAEVGKFIWKIVGNSTDGWTLQNLATGNYMSLGSSNGSDISSSTTPQTNGIYFGEVDEVIYATILNSNGQSIDIGAYGDNPTTWSGSTTPGGSRRLTIYEVDVVEIADDACYTLDFVSFDETKTWGLKAGTTEQAPVANGTGDVFVAHSYTNQSGERRWIFVNNSDGTYLAYHGQANTAFDISNAINEWNINILTSGTYVDAAANLAGKLSITNDKRNTTTSSQGCYLVKESANSYDNASAPIYKYQSNNYFTAAIRFTATGTSVSSAASLAIAKFEALYEVKNYLPSAGNITALFADPSSIESNINAAATAEAAATIATNFMKSPEGKKFYIKNADKSRYLTVGSSVLSGTSTTLTADDVMEVEYAGNRKYYLKGIFRETYVCTPNSSSNISTTATKGSAETFFIGNRDNDTDNEVYFSNKASASGNYGAIHYSSGYTYAVVGWTYNSDNSQWHITAVSDAEYTELCNATCDVTYNAILEASGTVKATATILNATRGAALSAPVAVARDYCTMTYYSDAACTDAITTVPAAATATVYVLVTDYNPPFTLSESYENATWYYANLRGGKYVRANESAKDGSGRYTTNGTNEKTDVYKWAFVGTNPYDLTIMNRGAGSSKVLYAESTTVPTMKAGVTPASDSKARWIATPNTTGAFALRNESGATLYINDAGGAGNLGFWNSTNGTSDAGSNWVITEVPTVDVTYELWDGEEKVNTIVVNGVPEYAEVAVPASLTTGYTTFAYDFVTSGTIGNADCTITVTATLKSGLVKVGDLSNTKKYKITSARGSLSTYTDGETTYLASPVKTSLSIEGKDFAILKHANKYYLYSVDDEQFVTYLSEVQAPLADNVNGTSDQISFQETSKSVYLIKFNNDANKYINSANSASYTYGIAINDWGSYTTDYDDGNQYVLEEDGDFDPKDALGILTGFNNIIAQLKAINWSDQHQAGQLNRYNFIGEYVGYAGNEMAAIETLEQNGYSDENYSTVQALNIKGIGYALNLPAAGKFYRIQGNTSSKYLAAGLASNSKFNMTDAEDATTIFYYDGTKLTNLSSGMCNGMTKDAWAWVTGANASVVTFQDGLTNGGYAIKSAADAEGTNNAYFYDNGDNSSSADRGANVNLSTDNTRYRSWYLTKIETLPVTISSVGYSTLYSPVALTIPTGVTAYIASDEGDYLHLTPIEGGIIPANTGVILAGNAATYDFTTTTGGSVDSNVLTGTVAAIARPGDSYILATGSAGVGFYADGATTIPGFKAYLPAAGGSPVKAFRFDSADAIESIVNNQLSKDNAAIYNLAGQRINKLQKGINIVNGKKVLVK